MSHKVPVVANQQSRWGAKRAWVNGCHPPSGVSIVCFLVPDILMVLLHEGSRRTMVISDALARSGSDHPNPGKSSIGISTSKILEHPGTRISTFGHIFMQIFMQIFMHFHAFSCIFQVHLKISVKKTWQNGKMAGSPGGVAPSARLQEVGNSEDQEIRFWGINQ